MDHVGLLHLNAMSIRLTQNLLIHKMQMFGNTLKVMTFDWLRTIDTREIISLFFSLLEN